MKKFSASYLGLFVMLFAITLPVARAVAEDDAARPKSDLTADSKTSDKDAKKPDVADGKKAPEDVSGGRFAGDPVYVHLAPMVLPIITEAGVEQLVTMQIDIQVKDFDTADTLHSNMPKVMDALMRGLYGGLGQGTLRNGKLVDISKIKAKATTALSSVVGGDGIRDVLIQGVAQRML